MPTIEARTVIRAPIEQVFEAITDPKRGLEWNPNMIDVDGVSGYPLGEGTSWTQTASVLGRPMTFHCTIVSWSPPHEGLLRISGPQQARMLTRCDNVPAGTQVTQKMEFDVPKGALGSMIGGAIAPRLQKEMNDTLARQRAALESEAGGNDGSGTV